MAPSLFKFHFNPLELKYYNSVLTRIASNPMRFETRNILVTSPDFVNPLRMNSQLFHSFAESFYSQGVVNILAPAVGRFFGCC